MMDQQSHERKTKRIVRPQLSQGETSSSPLYLVMVGMVALLLVFSVVQTVQIMNLKTKVQSGSVTTSVAAGPSQPAPQAAAKPAARPQMVGGC